MKITELSHNLIKKIPNNQVGHIYIDMDGVIACCEKGLANHFNVSVEEIIAGGWDGPHWLEMYKKEAAELKEFFAELPWESNGKKLIRWVIKSHLPYSILSRPMKGIYEKPTIEGKKIWLKREGLGNCPAIFEFKKEKYATTDGIPNILIDDLFLNIEKWQEAGGIGILYNNNDCNAALNQLASIFEKNNENR